MAKYHTNSTAIRKYKSEYYRLMAEEARLNLQLFQMGQRIKAIQKDEEQSLANQTLLTSLLAHATEQKAKLEAQPTSKERDKQLKKADKEYKGVNVQYKRNELRLAVLDKKKDKDNAAKYILKELKRDQVRIRIKAAYAIWKKLEQAEQYEFMDFEMFQAVQMVKQIHATQQSVSIQTTRPQTSTTPQSPKQITIYSGVSAVSPIFRNQPTGIIPSVQTLRYKQPGFTNSNNQSLSLHSEFSPLIEFN